MSEQPPGPADTKGGPPPQYVEQPGQPAPVGVQPVGPPAYPPQGQPQPQVVVQPATTVVVAQPMMMGEAPVTCQCPACGATVTTSTSYQNGLLTWIAIGGLCIVGCWLGCCLIPLCIDACKDVEHSCPNCNRLIGKYQRIK